MYKIVCNDKYDAELWSLTGTNSDDYCTYAVHYIPNQWAHPRRNMGPLTVFNTVNDVEEFLNCWPGYITHCQVWECEIVRSRSYRVWDGESKYDETELCDLPEGTVLADAVLLTKEVEWLGLNI